MGEQQLRRYKISYHQFSEIGKRKTNQDKVSINAINNEFSLFLVADGMGGYSHGDLAAALVIENIEEKINPKYGDNLVELINEAVYCANNAIKNLVIDKGCDCGATLGGILFAESKCYLFWIGDVKIVLCRNDEINFTSISHTLENELRINRSSDYINLSVRHVVTRSLSGKEKMYQAELKEIEINIGDRILIASDGFYDLFSEREMLTFMKSNMSLETSFDNILPNRFIGARDNASGVLINVTDL